MKRRRVLLFGLDGATWRILTPMIERGDLPHLAALWRGGCHGVLQSTIPPVTATAWTTFQTGLLPGNHGVFDFNQHLPRTYETRVVSARDIHAPTLWDLASAAGRRVVVLNVPLTYPPRPINGAMVTGMLTPTLDARLTHPKQLQQGLLASVPDYRILVPQTAYNLRGWRHFVRASERAARARTRAFRFLLENEVPDWDLAMLHFQETDTLQHAVYPWLDPAHPEFSRTRYLQALPVYQAIDEGIGELVASLDDGQTLMFVLSDHGHHAVSHTVNVNAVLADAGLLQVAGSERALSPRALGRGALAGLLRLDRWNLNKHLLPRSVRRRLVERVTDTIGIAWEKTKAYMLHGWVYAYVHVNLQGREPAGTVAQGDYRQVRKQAAAALEALRDPDTGRPVVARVLTGEEAFPGLCSKMAPDLVVVPQPGYEFSASLLQGRGRLIRPNLPRRDHAGTHSPDGIVLVYGPNVSQGLLETARLVDLFPTVLAWLGLPVPAYAEGSILQRAFAHPLEASVDAEATLEQIGIAKGNALTGNDERVIEERLRSLGYM